MFSFTSLITVFRVQMNEKYSVMTPFGVLNKILGPQMFSPTSRETLGDKIELYFHDPSFVPLFMQVSLARICVYISLTSSRVVGELPEDDPFTT